MRTRIALLVAVASLIGADLSPADASAAVATHTKRQAELNILRSSRFFWNAGLHRLLRSRTLTFRTNVTVSCGRKLASTARAHVFSCALRYRGDRIVVRYTALGQTRFHLKIVSV